MMERGSKLKLFISYSHEDNTLERPFVREFKRHIVPLRDRGLIGDWYDREIFAGEDYQTKIDNNLEDADIVCFFISANFLSSTSCMQEKSKAFELKRKKWIFIIPIILSPCGWQEYKDMSSLLALPEDGKPISSFTDRDAAWHSVYSGLKKLVERETELGITDEFENFLQDMGLLAEAHPRREKLLLDDVFTPIELDKFSNLREYEGRINSDELLSEHLLASPKLAIAGEDQSGKTTLCKKVFGDLRRRNFIPVYVTDKKGGFRGKIENKISSSFSQQYKGVKIGEIDKERIVPIVDGFHLARDKERHIVALSQFAYCVITVDDIFGFNFKNERLISSFSYSRIRELKPSSRYELVRRWVYLTNEGVSEYGKLDKMVEQIELTLGKTIGKGILPAYPFFILSALMTYQTFAMPLNQEITSQGYCYQAFVYFYLKKQGVKEDEIDIYMNFLTELAFNFYKERKRELSADAIKLFVDSYSKKYILPLSQEILLENLSQIVSVDSFNSYSFRYPYLYYFFVARYLAAHAEDADAKKEIRRIVDNLQIDENAYIAIFIAHHARNVETLEGAVCNLSSLFAEYAAATLSKEDVRFFDEKLDIVIEAVLPSPHTTPEEQRGRILKVRDEMEDLQEGQDDREDLQSEEDDDPLVKDLRKAIKLGEVVGCIMKNRAGSLERTRLAAAFKEAMLLHLRIVSSFLEVVRTEEQQQEIVDFVAERLRKIAEEREKVLSRDETEKYARTIFWNLNFFFVYGFVSKIVHSLGSDKLGEIGGAVCDEMNTPAAFAIKQGISMWYAKYLDIDEVAQRIRENDFSLIAERVMKLMIVNHCALHKISYKDRQKIESKLGIPTRKLLAVHYKEL